jgi:hypothetical protein
MHHHRSSVGANDIEVHSASMLLASRRRIEEIRQRQGALLHLEHIISLFKG